jgi:hypothetical protein
MDQTVLVDEIQRLARELRERQGPIALLMLMAPDLSVDGDWNIIVSARGFDKKTRASSVKELTQILRKNLSKTLWPQITRATVLRTNDPFVRAMNATFRTKRSLLQLQSCSVSGFEIPKAIVFESKKVAA